MAYRTNATYRKQHNSTEIQRCLEWDQNPCSERLSGTSLQDTVCKIRMVCQKQISYRDVKFCHDLMDYVNLITLPIRIEENVDIILFSRPFLESDTRMLMVMVHCLHQNLALRRLWTACKHASTSHERMEICVNFVFRNSCANDIL